MPTGTAPTSVVFVTRDAAGLHPRLSLPGASLPIVIVQHRFQGQRRRTGAAMGPQPQVDPVADAEVGRLRDEAYGFLDDPLEELPIRARPRARGPSLRGVHEDEVDVARVVQLPAAELSQRDHRDRRGPAGCLVDRPAPPQGDRRFLPGAMPGWADFNGGDIFYGFPDLEGRGVKFAHDAHGVEVDPDTQSREWTEAALAEIIAFLQKRGGLSLKAA